MRCFLVQDAAHEVGVTSTQAQHLELRRVHSAQRPIGTLHQFLIPLQLIVGGDLNTHSVHTVQDEAGREDIVQQLVNINAVDAGSIPVLRVTSHVPGVNLQLVEEPDSLKNTQSPMHSLCHP